MKKFFFTTLLVSFFFALNIEAQIRFCSPNTAAGLRSMYVSDTDDILGDTDSEIDLLEWAEYYDFNYLILYKIKGFLANAPNSNSVVLGDFIEEAHSRGIQIGVVVSSFNASLPIKDYLTRTTIVNNPDRWYDALHYEEEYWNWDPSNSDSPAPWDDPSPEIDSFKETLEDLNSFCQDQVNEIICEVYIGNPTHGDDMQNAQGQIEVNHMAANSDRIHVTYYRNDPYTPNPNIFLDRLWRLEFLANADSPVNISVLFNARLSSEPNMFHWLTLGANRFKRLWKIPFNVWHDCHQGYLDNLNNNTSGLGFPLGNINVLGYTWYNYQSLLEISYYTPPIIDPYGDTRFHGGDRTRIFPNPASHQIEIILEGNYPQALYEIVDINGKQVITGKISTSSTLIDVQQLATGIYTLQVKNGKEQLAQEKLIIQH